ncbi:MAG: ABC transporter permease [Peptococcales bacterium]|jgi:peptide/nickel transport system permease protein
MWKNNCCAIGKRVFVFLLTFLVVYTFNFFIPRLMPGDPFSHSSSVSGEDMEGLSQKELDRLKAYYGLDKPILAQFTTTIKQNLKGDFGESILYKKSVKDVIMARIPWTIYIMFVTLVTSLFLGIFLALICIKRSQWDAFIYKVMSFVCELPSFIIGVLFLFLIANKVQWIPLAGNITPFKTFNTPLEYISDVFLHSLLPILALVVVTTPVFYFTSRSSFKTIMNKQYVLNAHGKGLSERVVRYKYILLNAILPIVARFFLSVGNCIGATILIENVFTYPGLGKILRDAVMYRDFVLIQGVFLLSTSIVLVSSLLSDLINYYIHRGTK